MKWSDTFSCLPWSTRGLYPRSTMMTPDRYKAFVMTVFLLVMTFSTEIAMAQNEGPRTPTASGTSPLLGILIAMALGVVLVVVSMIPSKRYTEDT